MKNNILRLKDIKHKTGLSRSTIYNLIAQGNFPKQISLGGRAVGWIEYEIDNWIVHKIKYRAKVMSTKVCTQL